MAKRLPACQRQNVQNCLLYSSRSYALWRLLDQSVLALDSFPIHKMRHSTREFIICQLSARGVTIEEKRRKFYFAIKKISIKSSNVLWCFGLPLDKRKQKKSEKKERWQCETTPALSFDYHPLLNSQSNSIDRNLYWLSLFHHPKTMKRETLSIFAAEYSPPPPPPPPPPVAAMHIHSSGLQSTPLAALEALRMTDFGQSVLQSRLQLEHGMCVLKKKRGDGGWRRAELKVVAKTTSTCR